MNWEKFRMYHRYWMLQICFSSVLFVTNKRFYLWEKQCYCRHRFTSRSKDVQWENSLGQLTSHPLNWPSFGKGENKSQLINILIRHCNPSRIRNIKIERSKQLYHSNTLPLFSSLPKLSQWMWRQLTERIRWQHRNIYTINKIYNKRNCKTVQRNKLYVNVNVNVNHEFI